MYWKVRSLGGMLSGVIFVALAEKGGVQVHKVGSSTLREILVRRAKAQNLTISTLGCLHQRAPVRSRPEATRHSRSRTLTISFLSPAATDSSALICLARDLPRAEGEVRAGGGALSAHLDGGIDTISREPLEGLQRWNPALAKLQEGWSYSTAFGRQVC